MGQWAWGETFTEYEYMQYLAHYARWDPEHQRREYWPESIDRYLTFFKTLLKERCGYKIPDTLYKRVRRAIVAKEVMPSMRCLWTAGEALRRDEAAAYNCSFLTVSVPRAFDETMYLLMCGTGVGFSVEKKYTEKLPHVNESFNDTDTTVAVHDSRKGWAKSLREFIGLLYNGVIPKWDVSRVRPAGSVLKTFGGRASGPGPLVSLFEFCIKIFKGAAGRKLTPVECHHIMTKIGECVVSGGVRRSAMISLSDLGDYDMRHVKDGTLGEENNHLELSNNSAVYDGQPSPGQFMKEWEALYASKRGERGIFNRAGIHGRDFSSNYAWRRDHSKVVGTNPCVVADTWVQTADGPRQVHDLIEQDFEAIVEQEAHKSESVGFVYTGHKPTYMLTTKRGYQLRLTGNHELLKQSYCSPKIEKTEWATVDQLQIGDSIKLANQRSAPPWGGDGSFAEGWLVGELLGDGGFATSKNGSRQGYVRFWGESAETMLGIAREYLKDNFVIRSDCQGTGNGVYLQIGSVSLEKRARDFMDTSKNLLANIERTSYNFYCGFLRGFFDADGSVQGHQDKGVSVRLSQSNEETLQIVQRMLARLGILSTLYTYRREAGMRPLPDGHGGNKEYYCRAGHELIIANDNLIIYHNIIGFHEPAKTERLDASISSYNRLLNRERFADKIVAIEETGTAAVYDTTIADVHEFDANGLRAHNCAEILLRDQGMCNLSEIVVTARDTFKSLARKAEIASILGTWQSVLTDFKYVRSGWQQNCEEERLLGVSMTGIFDNPSMIGLTNGTAGKLATLRQRVIDVNAKMSAKLGINPSVAVTCVKPSGTVSQVVGSASGIHPRYAPYYLRRVEMSQNSPMARVLHEAGVSEERSYRAPEYSTVFVFPIKSPDGSLCIENLDPVQHLKIWQMYQDYWCEHKPSATIYVKEHQWLDVGAWVYKNFKDCTGISFFPVDDHIFEQPPYEPVGVSEYEQRKMLMPEKIDWYGLLSEAEKEDLGDGAQEYACVGGACEL